MADIPWKELDKMKEIKHTQLDHPLTRKCAMSGERETTC